MLKLTYGIDPGLRISKTGEIFILVKRYYIIAASILTVTLLVGVFLVPIIEVTEYEPYEVGIAKACVPIDPDSELGKFLIARGHDPDSLKSCIGMPIYELREVEAKRVTVFEYLAEWRYKYP